MESCEAHGTPNASVAPTWAGARSDALQVVHLVAQLLGVFQRGRQHGRHLTRQQGVRCRAQGQPRVDHQAADWQCVHLRNITTLSMRTPTSWLLLQTGPEFGVPEKCPPA